MNDRRELFNVKISSQFVCARIKNLRVLLFVFVFLIGAFDYSFVSFAKGTTITSSYNATALSDRTTVNFFTGSGKPPFWTSGGPSLTFSIDSLTIDGKAQTTFRITYYTATSNSYTISKYFNVGDKITLPNVNTGKTISIESSGKYSKGSHPMVVTVTNYTTLTDNEALNEIVDQNDRYHEEEKNEATSAGDNLGSTLQNATNTLSSIEILKLPWTMLTDLFNALKSDGETSLTFPSFSLMGQTLWPSYTFSLSTLDTQFSVLFESVRLVSGVMLCVAFGKYLRSFFTKVFGSHDDQEDL